MLAGLLLGMFGVEAGVVVAGIGVVIWVVVAVFSAVANAFLSWEKMFHIKKSTKK